MRRLEQLGIAHEVVAFDPAVRSASDVAQLSGIEAARVLKTLVVDTGAGSPPILAMVPADAELDLKLLAATHGVRKLHMASHVEAERLTGLKVGGISALALLDRHWPVYLEEAAAGFDSVLVSAGARGFDLRIAVDDLVRLTSARVAPLTRNAGA